MKKTLFPLVAVLISLASVQGQITEEVRPMALGEYPSIAIEVPHATPKMVEGHWKTFMSRYGKVKNVKRASETVISGAQILNIGGAQTLDIYARTEPGDSVSRQVVWIDMGNTFVSSENSKDAYGGTVQLLEDFEHDVLVEVVKTEVEEQKKVLGKLHSDLDKLTKENASLHSTIDKSNKQIADAENSIPANLKDQENVEKRIEKETDAKARSKLTTQLSKLRKKHHQHVKTMDTAKERIVNAEADIKHNLEEQEIKKQEIAAQEQVVAEADQRLADLRAEGTR